GAVQQRRLQPGRRAADGDRLEARPPEPGRGGRLSQGRARDPGLPPRLRRQHGRGLDALRRQQRPAAGRTGGVRHQGRDQEHQLVPQRARRARLRDPSADPGARDRRPHRAGDAALGSGPGGDGLHAIQGVRARPTVPPRARPAGGGRAKECAHDYRYFREPALPPLDVQPAWIDGMRARLPELPGARRARFQADYALSAYEADILTQGRGLADYFEEAARGSGKPKTGANWALDAMLGEGTADDDRAVAASPIPPTHLVGLLRLMDDGTISGKIAKDVFEKMFRSGETAEAIVRREGLT